jgi:hypothetical protein
LTGSPEGGDTRSLNTENELAEEVTAPMQIVIALVVIWILFAVLSWLLHAAKWLVFIAIIASLVAIGAKYLRQIIR